MLINNLIVIMPISSISITENNLSRNGVFNAQTQSAPYNKLYFNLSGSLVGYKICLQKLNMYYSWANIDSTNNTFSIAFPTGSSGYTTVNVSIPVNYNLASVAELNAYLQSVLIANGMYLIDSNGDFFYWMQFVANPNAYGVSLILSLVPTSLPSTYTTPAGFIGFPSTSRTMRFITNNSRFNYLIGYASNTTFDGNTSAITYESSFSPQFSPVNTILVRCNIASNPLALNNDSNIIYTFTTKGTGYGSLIEVEPQNLVYYDIQNNTNVMIVEFIDQDYQPLNIRDPSISMLFLISD